MPLLKNIVTYDTYLLQSISPGNVITEFTKRMFSKDPKLQAQKMVPEFREMDTQDIVDAVVYALSSPAHVQVSKV